MNSVEIKDFNTKENTKINEFYNFYPHKELKPTFTLTPALFQNVINGEKKKELNTENIVIKGISSFKQFFPASKETRYRVLVYGDDNKLYINQLFSGMYSLNWTYQMTFETSPITLSFKSEELDAIILASKEKMMVWKTNGEPQTILDVPVITSMAMNDGVLFCTIEKPKFKIWYATNLSAENVGNISAYSNYISLEDNLGDANKVIAFDGDVFVFRDYGISKISYLQKNITVSQIYTSGSKIIANSVAVCGNTIMFITMDGIYSFNGTKVKKIDIDIHSKLNGANKNAVASALGNYYYIALNLKYSNDIGEEFTANNSIVIIDVNDFSYQIIRGVDAIALYPLCTEVFEKMLVITNNINNKIFEITTSPSSEYFNGLQKYVQIDNFADTTNTKLFNSLVVDASKDVSFTLEFDNNKSYTFTTKNDGVSIFRFRRTSKKANLKINSTKQDAFVSSVELKFYDY